MFTILFLGCVGALDLSRATPLAPGQLAIQAGGGAVMSLPDASGTVSTTVVGGAVGVDGGVARGLELGGEAGTGCQA